MVLTTPDTIRTLQRKLYAKAKQLGARLGVKNIGMPCAGKPHARFDEGGQEKQTMAGLLRHRQTKGAATDRLGLRDAESCSLLYQASLSGARGWLASLVRRTTYTR
jgi:hypothetical protein